MAELWFVLIPVAAFVAGCWLWCRREDRIDAEWRQRLRAADQSYVDGAPTEAERANRWAEVYALRR